MTFPPAADGWLSNLWDPNPETTFVLRSFYLRAVSVVLTAVDDLFVINVVFLKTFSNAESVPILNSDLSHSECVSSLPRSIKALSWESRQYESINPNGSVAVEQQHTAKIDIQNTFNLDVIQAKLDGNGHNRKLVGRWRPPLSEDIYNARSCETSVNGERWDQ